MNDTQQKALLAVLVRHLSVNPGIAQVELFVGSLALEMPVFHRPLDTARWILDRALAQPGPTLLIHIVRLLDNGDAALASLVELADGLAADPEIWRSITPLGQIDWSTAGDPLEVRDGRPFIDRDAFRSRLPRLGRLDSPGCTVVKGDSGHGKSYLHEFLRQLADQWGQGTSRLLRVGYSACPSSNRSGLTAEMVAYDLAPDLQTEFARRPRKHEDPHRYARNLVSWLTDYTPPGPLPALVILDGFDAGDDDRVPEDVYTFIEGLVAAVQKDQEVKARMRLVLLGYDLGRLESRELEFATEVLEWVDAAAIAGWFRKRYPDEPEYRYTDTADEIHRQLPDDSMRMRHLCNLVRAVGQGFEGP